MAINMLKGKNLTKNLLGETVSRAAYFLNRFPTKNLEKITTEENYSGFKLNLNHLRIFGFMAYRHVSGLLRKKLDDKGEMMILVRYHPTRSYKLFEVENKRIMIIRDVLVDELE